jgi:hypothetical protein
MDEGTVKSHLSVLRRVADIILATVSIVEMMRSAQNVSGVCDAMDIVIQG